MLQTEGRPVDNGIGRIYLVIEYHVKLVVPVIAA
jgi:hypothetical protein